MASKVKGLFRGLRYISKIFEEKNQQEMQIGLPTDVKHVAHIGWDGPSVHSPSWMKGFESLEGDHQSSPLNIGEPSKNHEVKRTSKDDSGTSSTKKEKSRRSRRHRMKDSEKSKLNQNGSVGLESPERDLPDIPKKSRRKKSKDSTSSRSSKSRGRHSGSGSGSSFFSCSSELESSVTSLSNK